MSQKALSSDISHETREKAESTRIENLELEKLFSEVKQEAQQVFQDDETDNSFVGNFKQDYDVTLGALIKTLENNYGIPTGIRTRNLRNYFDRNISSSWASKHLILLEEMDYIDIDDDRQKSYYKIDTEGGGPVFQDLMEEYDRVELYQLRFRALKDYLDTLDQ